MFSWLSTLCFRAHIHTHTQNIDSFYHQDRTWGNTDFKSCQRHYGGVPMIWYVKRNWFIHFQSYQLSTGTSGTCCQEWQRSWHAFNSFFVPPPPQFIQKGVWAGFWKLNIRKLALTSLIHLSNIFDSVLNLVAEKFQKIHNWV